MKTRSNPRLAAPLLALALTAAPALSQGGLTSRVDVSSSGAEGTEDANDVVFSGNGNVVAFSTRSHTLVPLDTNNERDVFVHDRITGLTERISVNTAGIEGDSLSQYPALSEDGRYVAFFSFADNLAPPTVVRFTQIFLRDRQLGTTELVSVSLTGGGTNSWCDRPDISGDGRYVAFSTSGDNLVAGDANLAEDVFLRDRLLGTTELISVSGAGVQGDGHSDEPSISADGRFVAFQSFATNLVAGDTNGKRDGFVRDRLLGTTIRATLGDVGQESDHDCLDTDVSDDGRMAVFTSFSPWLVAGDANGVVDVFVRDLLLGTTVLASVSSAGVQANAISNRPSISGDGRHVVFSSQADNLTLPAGGPFTDVFVRDVQLGQTELASVSSDGVPASEHCFANGISGDGQAVSFTTEDPGLAPSTVHPFASFMAYVRDHSSAPAPARTCEAKQNSQACWPTIAWSGTPTLAGPDDFHVTAGNVLNQQVGILLWGTAGQKSLFSAAFLCVTAPQRTGPQTSGGNPPPSDCSGTYDFHVSQAFLAANGFVAGDLLYTQFWSRDPFLPASIASGLTRGLHAAIGP